MNGTSAALCCALAALSAVPGLAQDAKRTSTAVAREEAERNANTPAGRRYATALESRVEPWLRPTLQRCVKDVAKEELISFDAFVRVGAAGEAEEVVFGPETAVSRCAEPDFRAAKYPSPPQPSWWVRIEVQLR